MRSDEPSSNARIAVRTNSSSNANGGGSPAVVPRPQRGQVFVRVHALRCQHVAYAPGSRAGAAPRRNASSIGAPNARKRRSKLVEQRVLAVRRDRNAAGS
jgi:hypothetical protein